MIQTQCKHYKTCKAPLCPFDKNIDTIIWYPDEPICRLSRGAPEWRKKQRKIARRTIYRDFFFKVSDIERVQRVSRGIRGHNPDYSVNRTRIRGGY